MANLAVNRIIHHFRNAVLTGDRSGLSDGELLNCFLTQGDEAAFAALVRRYSPMVLGACQRVLRNRHDAEDAFQATFLVLVRKGSSIVPRDRVGNWLYGVAYRTALEARKVAAKRRLKERTMPRTEAVPGDVTPDLTEVLDQELEKLPDKYRAPLVLCDLQGKTRKEAARHLGCPEGTVAGRLVRARQLLARRLAQRGVTVTAAGLALFFSHNVGSAAVPATLVAATVKAGTLYAAGSSLAEGAIAASVTVLAEGVIKTMVIMKLKAVAACLLAFCLLTVGLGLSWHGTWVADAHAAPVPSKPDPARDKDKPPAKNLEKPADNQDKKEEPAKKDEKPAAQPPFSKIHLKSGHAVIRQTGKESVETRGSPIFVQRVKTSVENGTLHLEALPGVEFVVEVKDLSGLTVEGLGTLDLKDLKTKRLEVTVKGGQVRVSGTAEEQVITVSGLGRFDGEDCKGKQAKVEAQGSGQVVVNVSDKLQVNIQGLGRVNYLGSPTVEKNVAFGGQLLQGPPNAGGYGPGGYGAGYGRQGLQPVDKRLGAHLEPPSPLLIDQLGLPEKQGMVLREVPKDSAADKAGLKTNDILLELNGKPVPSDRTAFTEFLGGIKPDQKVNAVVVRKGQKVTVKDLTLPEAKDIPGSRPERPLRPYGVYPPLTPPATPE
jgi:RNA polymerase sigma factor (sigma-70 family)